MSLLCIVIDCGPLENPSNGTVTINSGVDAVIITGHHAVATYTCDLGYRLDSGSSTRTCGTSGTWSGTMAVCVCKYMHVAILIASLVSDVWGYFIAYFLQ